MSSATIVVLFVSLALAGSAAFAATITVFAAASLKEALDEQAKQFEARTGDKLVVSYAASNALARQIESGAPADVFISADLDWMDYLERERCWRRKPASNCCATDWCWSHRRQQHRAADRAGIPPRWRARIGNELALADPARCRPASTPRRRSKSSACGRRSKRKVAPAENVRAALALVERGEAALGIVYATDALASDRVEVLETFPESSHPPIRYPAAVLGGSRPPEAAAFLAFSALGRGAADLRKHGFGWHRVTPG